MIQSFYKDFLFKKQKPKSEILEGLLELNEHQLSTVNEIHSLYNVSIPTQDDVWICGRIYSDDASNGGGGKLTEHNIMLQGSYVCSNSHSIPLSLTNCPEYSLFPGQIILAKGRNPDGKRFLCNEIIEPCFVADTAKKIKKEFIEEPEAYNSNNSITVKLCPNEDLMIIVASGPYMFNGTILTDQLELLIDVVKAKNAHVLILLGPFLDANNDLIASGNINFTFEELLQNIFDSMASQLQNTKVQVLVQPSLKDITQEPVYPIHPFIVSSQFIKQNENFHFLAEPSTIKINDIPFAITSTDVVKDLTMMTVSKTASSDKISRNFSHILRHRLFYPIYPPPENVCVDYEAWNKYAKIDQHPRIFISVSDLATFNKEVNNCVCLNPGKIIKGTSGGTYAKILISDKPIVNVDLNKIAMVPNKTILDEYQVNITEEPQPTAESSMESVNPDKNYVAVTFHKI